MEIAGLGIGVASIIGLVSTGLDMLDRVDIARDHSRSIGIIRTKLRNQRFQFEQWADKNLFRTGRYNPYLDQPDVRPRIEETFDQIWLLLGQSDTLSSRYQIKITAASLAFITQADHPSSSEDRFTALTDRLAAEQRDTTIWRLTRWAIRDEKKLKEIVQDLSTFVEDLYKMAGTSYERVAIASSTEAVIPHVRPVEGNPKVASEQRYESVSVRGTALLTLEGSMQHATLDEVLLDEAEEGDLYSASPPRNETSAGLSSAMHRSEESAGFEEETNTPKATTHVAFQPAYERLKDEDPDPPLRRFENIIEANQAAMQEAQRFMAWEATNSVVRNTKAGEMPAAISKRLLREIKDQNDQTKNATELSTYWSIMDDNILRIIGTVKGPMDTPWANGYFHLMIDIYPEHPFKTPECHFITKILHPDVETKAGKLCQVPHGDPKEFFDNWRPSQRITKLLEKTIENMKDPDWEGGLALHQDFEHLGLYGVGSKLEPGGQVNRLAYSEVAKAWTEKYASGHLLIPGSRYDGFCNTTINSLRRGDSEGW